MGGRLFSQTRHLTQTPILSPNRFFDTDPDPSQTQRARNLPYKMLIHYLMYPHLLDIVKQMDQDSRHPELIDQDWMLIWIHKLCVRP